MSPEQEMAVRSLAEISLNLFLRAESYAMAAKFCPAPWAQPLDAMAKDCEKLCFQIREATSDIEAIFTAINPETKEAA